MSAINQDQPPKRLLKIKRRDLSNLGIQDSAIKKSGPSIPPPPPPPVKITPKEPDSPRQKVLTGVVGFKRENLKRTKTKEKLFIPTKEIMTAERSRLEMLTNLKGFNKSRLKHVQVKEKIVLPTKEDIENEREVMRLPKSYINPPVTNSAKKAPSSSSERRLNLKSKKSIDSSGSAPNPPPPPPPPQMTVPPPPPTNVHNQMLTGVKGFKKENLKRTKTKENLFLPSKEEFNSEKARQEMLSKLQGFNKRGLKHVVVKEKVVLPTKEDLEIEREIMRLPKNYYTPELSQAKQRENVAKEVKRFNRQNLKRTDTEEKNVLPSKEDVDEERTHNEIMQGVTNFRRDSLKRTTTKEKVVLPTREVVDSEKNHQEMLYMLNGFNKRKLRHVQVKEKCLLPTKEDMEMERKRLHLNPLIIPNAPKQNEEKDEDSGSVDSEDEEELSSEEA